MHVYNAQDRDMAVPFVDVLCSSDALLVHLVHKHWPKGHITNAFACVELVVDHNAPMQVGFDTDLFNVEGLDVCQVGG